MKPSDFMNEIVVPRLQDFRNDRRSRRRAYLACIAVFHVKDHLKKAEETGVETAVRKAAGFAFDVVRAVCNGSKYLKTDASHPIGFRAGDDWYRPPAIAGVMIVGLSVLGDSKGGREITTGERGSTYIYAQRLLRLSTRNSAPDSWEHVT
jgi:hypothetical protein